MADKRQVYRVILQIMTYIGVATLLWVMFGSVFVPNHEKSNSPSNPPVEIMEMNLQNLAEGKITHVIWQGKKVSILHRNNQSDDINKGSHYFVYYDLGDSGNCPLYFTGRVFKDTCTGTQYDQTGKPVNNSRADDLESPPYFFREKTKLILGRKKSD